jgi:hypothetical protein
MGEAEFILNWNWSQNLQEDTFSVYVIPYWFVSIVS